MAYKSPSDLFKIARKSVCQNLDEMEEIFDSTNNELNELKVAVEKFVDVFDLYEWTDDEIPDDVSEAIEALKKTLRV